MPLLLRFDGNDERKKLGLLPILCDVHTRFDFNYLIRKGNYINDIEC